MTIELDAAAKKLLEDLVEARFHFDQPGDDGRTGATMALKGVIDYLDARGVPSIY